MQVKKLKSAKDKDIALQNSLDIEDKVSCRLVEVFVTKSQIMCISYVCKVA